MESHNGVYIPVLFWLNQLLRESHSSIVNTPLSNSSEVAPQAVTLSRTSSADTIQPLSHIGMTDTQKSRILRVAEGCQRLQPIRKITTRDMKTAAILNNMVVDDRLRYVYCRIGKVASTTWSRVLLIASGKVSIEVTKINTSWRLSLEHSTLLLQYREYK